MDRQHTDMQDDWRKASYSNGSGGVRRDREQRRYRRRPATPPTATAERWRFTADAWASFINGPQVGKGPAVGYLPR